MIDFFTPQAFERKIYDKFGDLTLVGEWIAALSAFVAMTLVMPFHTMAGFALYLNRRIELEAWDIEISFRSLASRKRATASPSGLLASLVFVLALALSVPGEAGAAVEHDRKSAAQLIEEVLDGEDFGQ